MNDRDRLRQAFEETFDMKTMPGFRQRVISQATMGRPSRPSVSRFAFAFGAAAAVVVIAGAVALLHMPAPQPAPAGQPSPSPTPPAALSAADLSAVAAAVYPKDPRYGYYVPCDETGSQSACPFTPRLQSQLAALKTTACLGCQNPFQQLVVSTEVATGTVTVAGMGYAYDLHVVSVAGRKVVDDIAVRCSNQSAGTGISVYAMHLQTSAAGQYPVPVPTCPA